MHNTPSEGSSNIGSTLRSTAIYSALIAGSMTIGCMSRDLFNPQGKNEAEKPQEPVATAKEAPIASVQNDQSESAADALTVQPVSMQKEVKKAPYQCKGVEVSTLPKNADLRGKCITLRLEPTDPASPAFDFEVSADGTKFFVNGEECRQELTADPPVGADQIHAITWVEFKFNGTQFEIKGIANNSTPGKPRKKSPTELAIMCNTCETTDNHTCPIPPEEIELPTALKFIGVTIKSAKMYRVPTKQTGMEAGGAE
jgi:hypothetical protein